MKRNGRAVQYPLGVGGVMGKLYNELLDDGHVNARLLGQVLDSCPTLTDKVNFLSALLLQPPTDQQREWIEAFGLAWRCTDIVARAEAEADAGLGKGCVRGSEDVECRATPHYRAKATPSLAQGSR